MSNTRRAKWDAAQVTAANAEALLSGVFDGIEAGAVARALTRRLAADMAAAAAPAGAVAAAEQALAGLDEQAWLDIAHAAGLLPLVV